MQYDTNTDVIWVSGYLFGIDVAQSFFWGMETRSGNMIIHLPTQDADANGVQMDEELYAYAVKDYTFDQYYFYIGHIKDPQFTMVVLPYDLSVFDFDISSDASLIAMITWGDRIRVSQLYNLRYELDIQHDVDLRTVLFDSQGQQIAVQTWGELPDVEIWDMETMTQRMVLHTEDWYKADCGE